MFQLKKSNNWPFKEGWKIFCGIIAYNYYNFKQDISTSVWIALNVICTDIFAKQYFVLFVKRKEQIWLKFTFCFLSLFNFTSYLTEIRH